MGRGRCAGEGGGGRGKGTAGRSLGESGRSSEWLGDGRTGWGRCVGEGGGGRSVGVGEGSMGEGGDYGGGSHWENGDRGHWGWSGSRGIRG